MTSKKLNVTVPPVSTPGVSYQGNPEPEPPGPENAPGLRFPSGGWTWTPADYQHRKTPYTPAQEGVTKGPHSAGMALLRAWGMNPDVLKPPQKRLPDYVYKPLPPGKFIRVLRLLPGRPEEDIIISLSNQQLVNDSSPASQYIALSYQWGFSFVTKPHVVNQHSVTASVNIFKYVNCDGKLLRINDTLSKVLQKLRKLDESIPLWIDAICIDQENDEEKNTQLPLMREIYSFAMKTILWLGYEDENTADAFALISELASVWKVVNDGKTGNWIETEHFEEYKHLIDHEKYVNTWTGLRSLFSNSYFSRIWVVQEIVKSPNGLITCGYQTCTWLDFRSAFNLIIWSNLLNSVLPGADVRDAFGPLISVTRLNDFGLSKQENDYLHRLDQLLVNFLSHEATKPRDRVYGMLGLMQQEMGGRKLQPLIPDCRKPTQQVYQDATEWCIRELMSLSVIDMIGSVWYNDLQDLPSWVPDLTTGRRKCMLQSEPGPLLECFASQYIIPAFNKGVMSTKALIFDMVTSLGAPLTQSSIPITLMEQFWSNCLSSQSHPTGLKYLDVIWRTFIYRGEGDRYGAVPGNSTKELAENPANGDDFAHLASVDLLDNFGLPEELSGHDRDIKDIAEDGLHGTLGHVFPDDVKANISILALRAKHPKLEFLYRCLRRGDAGKFVRQAKKNKILTEGTDGRQLFTTEEGYVGLGPATPHGEIIEGELFMKPGAGVRTYDVVAILSGSESVFILRPEPISLGGRKTYRIVGNSYIYGVSDALCFEKNGVPKMEMIDIV